MVDAMESVFGRMYRVGGPKRVYSIGDGTQNGAIFTVGENSAMAFGWDQDELVDTIYWWDDFYFQSPDYALDIPAGIDVERLVPTIKHAISTKQLGRIDA